MTIDEYINFGNRVWASLKPGGTVPLSTNTMAAILAGDGEDSLAKTYTALKKLAKVGFPAVTRGPEQAAKRWGKPITMRPYLWQRPADGDHDMAEWVERMSNTALAGPYASIEKRLNDLEARVKELENYAS